MLGESRFELKIRKAYIGNDEVRSCVVLFFYPKRTKILMNHKKKLAFIEKEEKIWYSNGIKL